MKSITDKIYEYMDDFGSEFQIGDWVEFEAKGLTIMAEVTSEGKDENQYIVKPIGFRYDPKLSKEEVEKLKASLKKEYKLNTKRKVYKLAKPEGKEDLRYYK